MPELIVDSEFLQRFQSTSSKPSSEALRLWVQFFSSKLNSSSPIVIPNNWMPFFIFLLLQSPTFSCAKEFLQSNAWDYFKNDGNSSIFYLPTTYPKTNIHTCSLFESTSSVILEDLDDLDTNQVTPS